MDDGAGSPRAALDATQTVSLIQLKLAPLVKLTWRLQRHITSVEEGVLHQFAGTRSVTREKTAVHPA